MKKYKGNKDDAVIVLVNHDTYEPIYVNMEDLVDSKMEDYNKHMFFENNTLKGVCEFKKDLQKYIETKAIEMINVVSKCLPSKFDYVKNSAKIHEREIHDKINAGNYIDCGLSGNICLLENCSYYISFRTVGFGDKIGPTITIGDNYIKDLSLLESEIKHILEEQLKQKTLEQEALNNRVIMNDLVMYKALCDAYGGTEKLDSLLKEHNIEDIK